jgi:hypothetical protein
MQIPPSTVQSVEKEVWIQELLLRLTASKFSGYCVITHKECICSLIFSEGKPLLAEYPALKGGGAWRQIQAMRGKRADAVTYGLTPTQISLTLKFNEPCRIADAPGERIPGPRSPTTVITPVTAKGSRDRKVKIKAVIISGDAAGRPPVPSEVKEEEHSTPKERPPRKAPHAEGGLDHLSLESLKGLKESFRVDAASLLKELDLEHLITEANSAEDVQKSGQGLKKTSADRDMAIDKYVNR